MAMQSDSTSTVPDETAATSSRSRSRRPATDEPILRLEGVTKRYGPAAAVSDLSISVHRGELLTLVGPSGCGKTTTLRLMAGLERPTEGAIYLDGECVAGNGGFRAPEDRGVGIVFQDFALFPHLSVEENIAFGLKGDDPSVRDHRVDELLGLVGLEGYRERQPDQLSGGEQQRVALARSLAPEPAILLLDEPFSNLDVHLRVEMREEVRRILKAAGVTAVSVTHDQEEALSISDRVAVMSEGRIEQSGQPESVFEHPKSRFVASFLGQASFLTARLTDGTVRTAIGDYPAGLLEGYSPEYDGADIDVLVRPDDLRAEPGEVDANGQIIHRMYTGPNFVYRVELGNGDVVHCQHNHTDEMRIGQPVEVSLDADHSLAWYPAR